MVKAAVCTPASGARGGYDIAPRRKDAPAPKKNLAGKGGSLMDREALRQTLLEILESETWQKHEHLDDGTNLRTGLNLDSVDLISLVLRVQTDLKVDSGSKELESVVTVGDLLDLLQAKLPATAAQAA
jgi:acyl carrier protein